ncbi:MAG: class I SAM-dependent methyltransferase [Planctomycetota bacterium]
MKTEPYNLSDKPERYYQSSRQDMLKYVPPDVKTSLEFGCGVGQFSALLKQTFDTESWAVEIDEEAAAHASEKLDRVINKDASAALQDVPDGYFDCIILFDILEHLVNPFALLSALKTKLTHNGVVVVSIPNVRYYRAFVDYVIRADWDYKDHGILDNTHLRFFTCKSIKRMFERLDFEVLVFEGIHPTSSRTFKLLNMILSNFVSDLRYKHFAAVVRPRS